MLVAYLDAMDLLAQTSGRAETPPSPVGILWIILWVVCATRRKQEMGGWLLFYYIQLYLGLVFSVVMLAISFQNYLPRTWANAPGLYPLFLLSTLPAFAIIIAQLVVAERLRLSRDQRHLVMLKRVLWINLAFAGIASAIDATYFPENIAFDVIAFVWPLIWLPYFYRSNRVARVFITKDWVVPASGPSTA